MGGEEGERILKNVVGFKPGRAWGCEEGERTFWDLGKGV